MDTTPIIELKGLAIGHDEGLLLSDVNVSVTPGEFVYLIGKSGAGKTSLLRTLYGDHDIDDGEARVCGFDLRRLRRRQVPQLRRRVGIVFQNFRLLKDRNVYDNLAFVLKATGWKRQDMDKQIVDTLRAVGIARALINNPELILADEPTGKLDPATS